MLSYCRLYHRHITDCIYSLVGLAYVTTLALVVLSTGSLGPKKADGIRMDPYESVLTDLGCQLEVPAREMVWVGSGSTSD